MQEEFLHHIWQWKTFAFTELKTVQGEELQILHSGHYLQKAGPDFFNARLLIGQQKWAGNVEIHLKSSDWYIHHHQNDPAYHNVILHVVWEHDTEVFRKDNSEIPVLELRHYVAKETLENYLRLSSSKSWINCEKDLHSIDAFLLRNWQERLFFDRLERRSVLIAEMLRENENDWEATCFCFLAKSFGLNGNRDAFFEMAISIPFAVIRKEKSDVRNLEALFFGRAGMLLDHKEDVYYRDLQARWNYLSDKYRLPFVFVEPVQFFKLRPDNFPTIRLAQLAKLCQQEHLFSKLMDAASAAEIYAIFNVKLSEYWQTHYQFEKVSPQKKKSLTPAFIDLIIMNAVVPLKYSFAKYCGKESSEALIALLTSLNSEKNVIVDKFRFFGLDIRNAFDSQTALYLKNEYCNHGKCLQCGIGIELLKK